MDYGRAKLGVYDDFRKLQNEEELLIFGYSCKLFRDDEKALLLENGEHLIPWMGDSNLMIDRFDVRGALYDLREAEAKGRPLEEVLTEAELKEEEICDQERYFALYYDEFQHQIAYEEESKRLQVELASDETFYNQVSFNYNPTDAGENEIKDDLQLQTAMTEPITYNPSSDEDTFIPPPELNVPPGIEVPKTVKQNKIIIKTAKFVVNQGSQMEIIIKTKQAGNTLFNFLAFDNPLNAYYKFIINLVRSGRYRWEDDLDATQRERNDQYLHPNLSQSQTRPPPDLTPGVTSSPARPSPHCAYSKLITKIREKQKATTSNAIEDTELAASSSPLLPSSPLRAVVASVPGASQDLRPTPAQAGTAPFGPVTSLVDYPSSFNQTADGTSDGEDSEPRKATRGPSHDYRHIKWPPPDLQMVIDKMASYIIKNGTAFEDVVRSRGDPRFEFLNKSHEYHPYYKCKIQLYNEVYGDIFKNASKGQHDWRKKAHGASGTGAGFGGGVNGASSSYPKKSSSSSAASDHSKNNANRTISFSIKSREQEVPLTSRTTFPIESSTSEEDEDMEEEERERRRAERAQRRQARRNREEKEKREREEFLKKERLKREKEEEERKETQRTMDEDSSGNEDLYDIFKYAQEMEQETTSPRTQQQAQQQQQQQPAARPESPEEPNSKQEERKKKAAAFLSKLKDSKEDKKTPVYGPQIPPDIAAGLLKSGTQSPSSSRESAETERGPPPIPPPPAEPPHQPPPPLPKSPSPPLISESFESFDKTKAGAAPASSNSRELSSSPKQSGKPENSTSIASVLSDLNEAYGKQSSERGSEITEAHNRKSRSHRKHGRHKSESRSPSGRRDRKKRKRSRGRTSHRRKKRRSRSRSRSRSRAYSKSHRSSHKKKQSKHHTSHRDKEKSRKKKRKKQRSPSLVSSLPSSESSSPSTPSTLPSESESDMDIQVIESDEGKRSSRGSSIVSLPSTSSVSGRCSNLTKTAVVQPPAEAAPLATIAAAAGDGSASGGENSSPGATSTQQPQAATNKYSRSFLTAIENSNSSEDPPQPVEVKPLFNPNASSALAKIAQGLRAKLNAMLEKESKLE